MKAPFLTHPDGKHLNQSDISFTPSNSNKVLDGGNSNIVYFQPYLEKNHQLEVWLWFERFVLNVQLYLETWSKLVCPDFSIWMANSHQLQRRCLQNTAILDAPMDKTKVSKVICEDALEELQLYGWSTTIVSLNFVWHFSCLAAFFQCREKFVDSCFPFQR